VRDKKLLNKIAKKVMGWRGIDKHEWKSLDNFGWSCCKCGNLFLHGNIPILSGCNCSRWNPLTDWNDTIEVARKSGQIAVPLNQRAICKASVSNV